MTASTTHSSRRAATMLALGLTLTAVAGCATVPGAGSADPTALAAYQSTLASSIAAAAEAAGKAACTSWSAGISARGEASKATADFTQNPKWTWAGITPLLTAEYAAIATEANQLTSTIAGATSAAAIHTALVDYKAKLDAYNDALHQDHNARRPSGDVWSKSNAAADQLRNSALALRDLCE